MRSRRISWKTRNEAFESLAAVEDRDKNLLEAWKCFKAAEGKLPVNGYEEQRARLQSKIRRLEARLGVSDMEEAAQRL